jgi:putative transposase
MKLYKASHTVFSLKYHIVWITKKRVRKFYRVVADRAKEILAVVGEENDVMIEEVSVEPDHVHLYVMIGPEQALCDAIAAMKAASAKLLQQEYPYLADEKGRVWGRGYFVTSVNDKTTSAVIKKYIQNQWTHRAQLDIFEVK